MEEVIIVMFCILISTLFFSSLIKKYLLKRISKYKENNDNPIANTHEIFNNDRSACNGIIREISTAEPMIMELVSSRILKIFNPIKDPGISIKKRTALAAPKESPKEPLSKNGVKNRAE